MGTTPLLDPTFKNLVPIYQKMSPYVANDLFLYNCASCHYMPRDFSRNIQGPVPFNSEQLRTTLCSTKHVLIDSHSCGSLNDFETFLIARYLNGFKN